MSWRIGFLIARLLGIFRPKVAHEMETQALAQMRDAMQAHLGREVSVDDLTHAVKGFIAWVTVDKQRKRDYYHQPLREFQTFLQTHY
jgi:hypothetical protein